MTLARILRPWGRRGEVAAEILTDFPRRLAGLSQVWLGPASGPRRKMGVLACRLHKGQAVFQFAGVSSIEQAENLRGLLVQLPFGQRAALPEGRHYLSDLIGCQVWQAGAASALGTVRQVQPINAGQAAPEAWVLSVQTRRGEVLIPLASRICTRIDTARRRIDVDLPEGLLELNR